MGAGHRAIRVLAALAGGPIIEGDDLAPGLFVEPHLHRLEVAHLLGHVVGHHAAAHAHALTHAHAVAHAHALTHAHAAHVRGHAALHHGWRFFLPLLDFARLVDEYVGEGAVLVHAAGTGGPVLEDDLLTAGLRVEHHDRRDLVPHLVGHVEPTRHHLVHEVPGTHAPFEVAEAGGLLGTHRFVRRSSSHHHRVLEAGLFPRLGLAVGTCERVGERAVLVAATCSRGSILESDRLAAGRFVELERRRLEVAHLFGHVVRELVSWTTHAEALVGSGHACKEFSRVGSSSGTPPLDTTSSVDPLSASVRAELATGAVRVHDTRAAAVGVDELVDGVAPEEVGGNGLFRGPVAGRVEVLEAKVNHLCLELPVVEFAGLGLVEHVVERVALRADDPFDEVREVDLPGIGFEFEYLLPDLLR